MKIAILGGGVSGLSMGWFLKRLHPGLHISLFEGSSRLGGWIDSRRSRPGDVLFESGPRTLRPGGVSGLATLELIHGLGLSKGPKLVAIPKTSSPAKNRFIFLDGSLHNLKPQSLLRNSKLRSALLNAFMEPFAPGRKGQSHDDESIASFVERRLGKPMVDHILSAVIHGIYAGDVNHLSLRSTFPFLWNAEHDSGSLLRHVLKSTYSKRPSFESQVKEYLTTGSGVLESGDHESFIQFAKKMNAENNIYTFQDGLESLVREISQDLNSVDGFEILSGSKCVGVNTTTNRVQISLENGQTWVGDHVVSALPSYQLPLLMQNLDVSKIPCLNDSSFVTVAVVNLCFSRSKLPLDGFGYLVPRSELENAAGVLGVIFDSCIQQNAISVTSMNTPNNQATDDVNITVMMGGYAFEKYFGPINAITDSLQEAILELALKTVSNPSTLALSRKKLLASHVSIHKQCIPSYPVGHATHLKQLSSVLAEHGRITVIGNSYAGVGINDCIRNAKRVALQIARQAHQGRIKCTGLEDFIQGL